MKRTLIYLWLLLLLSLSLVFIPSSCSKNDVYNEVQTVVGGAGRVWMDRNLGATRVAENSTDPAAFGYLYQWGRGTDGHQFRTSGTLTSLSTTNNPGHTNFITYSSAPYDWHHPQIDNLWEGAKGINNPCPKGFRIPTEKEWNDERLTWGTNDAKGAFASPLKLTLAGTRSYSSGSLGNVGTSGYYWSSTADATKSRSLYFSSSSGASMLSSFRAIGFSVRCIKD
jgi:uncharacterized protein (TIGR02145 family)